MVEHRAPTIHVGHRARHGPPDPKEPVPVLDPKAPTLDPLKDPKEPLKVEPTDPLEDDPTVGPKGFVNPHDNADEEVNPGVGTIVGIGPVFATVEEMMAAVVAGLVAAAVLDSVDISSKGDYSFESFSFSFRSRSLQKQVISRLAIIGFFWSYKR